MSCALDEIINQTLHATAKKRVLRDILKVLNAFGSVRIWFSRAQEGRKRRMESL